MLRDCIEATLFEWLIQDVTALKDKNPELFAWAEEWQAINALIFSTGLSFSAVCELSGRHDNESRV